MHVAGFGFLVYPGGNYGTSYRWDRPNVPTELDTDRFLELVDRLGATPKISVNLNAEPELADRWIRYVNGEKGAGVRYWELGDELYFSLSGSEFVEKARRFVPAMKAADPSIKIIANVSVDRADFTRTVVREAGDLIDVYSFHFFPLPPSKAVSSSSPYEREKPEAFSRDLLASTPRLREQLATLKGWVRELAPRREVKYHVGSFTPVWWGPEGWTVNALPDALWVADVLGTLAELQVEAAAYWALLNPYPPGQGDFGLFSPARGPAVRRDQRLPPRSGRRRRPHHPLGLPHLQRRRRVVPGGPGPGARLRPDRAPLGVLGDPLQRGGLQRRGALARGGRSPAGRAGERAAPAGGPHLAAGAGGSPVRADPDDPEAPDVGRSGRNIDLDPQGVLPLGGGGVPPLAEAGSRR
ncbi:hypothetical protein LIP_2447 [Limnochorda pilosa]|uniref:Uncharacterized protein n=1 Tax=Limnochorda pilosa TaxID=1555112 RepID=A0A0K2SMD1_LIMPI|nr:hypothetical protein [Limnochorda pilosa]BAS28288.1 hypothetical protein LIP_2447 [Limnochorda pilosa]